jgi:hypothetical protein
MGHGRNVGSHMNTPLLALEDKVPATCIQYTAFFRFLHQPADGFFTPP